MLLALALFASIIVAVLPLCISMVCTLNLPDLDLRSLGLEHRRLLSRRAVNLRLMTRDLSIIVVLALFVVMYLLGNAGLDCLKYGWFGAAGPWLICCLAILPVGSYLASENDAKEAREGSETSVLAIDPNLGWQYQHALVKASLPREVAPSQLS
jgi:hypothetical protein